MAALANRPEKAVSRLNSKDKAAARGKNVSMAVSAAVAKPLRVLVSEGSSPSAREAVTILGLSGHHVEVCDPNRYCLARFSRFVRSFHHCPGLRDDPAGFLRFVERLLAAGRFDVLLPTHEQGFSFARGRQRLERHAGLALPPFASYRAVLGKAGFSRLLDQLYLPQPVTRIVASATELRDVIRFPAVVKTSVGTASRGVWFVRNDDDLDAALRELGASGAFADEVVVQDFVAGATEKAQAVFYHGGLIGFHGYRQIATGVGGGEAIKESVSRPELRAAMGTIGERLGWHGALSVDYIWRDGSDTPLLIDCNPRLVEPMSGWLAGIDLVGLLLEVSQGNAPAVARQSRDGVRTHLAMQALLGCAARGGRRRDIVREGWRVAAGRGPYAGSKEELTPLRLDWMGVMPVAMTAVFLLAMPKLAASLARRGWGAHLLDLGAIRRIERDDFPDEAL
jgi:predicted ATP-grasp superfamily ATP-dependent carboligase